jgi:glycosyltransferase involved in cell wall biosynthesis
LDQGVELEIFCRKSNYIDQDFSEISDHLVHFHEGKIINFMIRLGDFNKNKLGELIWSISTSILLLRNFRHLRTFKPNLIWVRDPLIAFLLSKFIRNSKLIIEVHNIGSNIIYKNLINSKKNHFFFPISESIRVFLNSIDSKLNLKLAPMGIDLNILASEREIKNFTLGLKSKTFTPLKIGYVGKFAPQGYSKGIEDLIALAQLLNTKNINYEIELIGGSFEEVFYFSDLRDRMGIAEKNLRFKRHIPHSEALKELKNFDVLVLPLPDENKYSGMPLKLLEYLASGRITIVTDSKLTRQLFGQDFQPYYYERNNPESLQMAIEKAICDDGLEVNIIEGVRFASNYSWKKRTESITKSIFSD